MAIGLLPCGLGTGSRLTCVEDVVSIRKYCENTRAEGSS